MKNLGILGLLFLSVACTTQAQDKTTQKKEMSKMETTENLNYATFSGGCFWCTEAIFDQLEGVLKVESGYSGGHIKNPAYREVCNGTTGHAEGIQIEFDKTKVSYTDLLEVFFATHNPTTMNRQGNDVGTQYRSAIFYTDINKKMLQERILIC